MDVPSREFPDELVKVIQLIANSHFVALDLEFSGISSRRTRGGRSRLSLQQAYAEVKEAAKQYQVLQVGLTIVEENTQTAFDPPQSLIESATHEGFGLTWVGNYLVRPYNFFINPVPLKEEYHHLERVWSYQSGASGRPHPSFRAKLAFAPDFGARSLLNIPHIAQGKSRVKHLPAALNRYQIRLTHQIIREEYTDLKTVGRDGFVRITIRNDEEDAMEKLRQERYREQDVLQAIEFRWLIEALCGGDISRIPERYFTTAIPGGCKPSLEKTQQFIEDLQRKLSTRRRILFGHNCFTDLIYLYACFIDDPPEKVEDFREIVRTLFPAVVDTKYLASLVGKLRYKSDLESLEKEMRDQQVPLIEVPPEFGRYTWGEKYHEAGFDSFMTAKVAIKLSARLEREGKLRAEAKPQRIVKAGETIRLDAGFDTEGEDPDEEYVTAPEYSTRADSLMDTLTSKFSTMMSTSEKPSQNISPPFDLRKLPESALPSRSNSPSDRADSQALNQTHKDSKDGSAQQGPDQPITNISNPPSAGSIASSAIPAAKDKKAARSDAVAFKGREIAIAHSNMFDLLDTAIDPVPSPDLDGEPTQALNESVLAEKESSHDPDADLLIWSDKEEDEVASSIDNRSKEAVWEGEEERGSPAPLTAEELENKAKEMAARGQMMPRWDGKSGIWNVIGNKLVVNACEEGVCIL